MKNNRKWLRVVVCMLSAFVGAFAYTLRGIAEQIQMSQVLHTVYGFALVIGGISFILAMYYLGKSRAVYTLYQRVAEEEDSDQTYVRAYRYLDYGSVSSNVLMIAMMISGIILISPIFKNTLLILPALILLCLYIIVANYLLRTIFIVRHYKLSVYYTPKDILAYLNSYDEGEKQAEMESAFLTLFRLDQILLPSLYFLLIVLSVVLREIQVVALVLLVVIHIYINVAHLRKTKRYFK